MTVITEGVETERQVKFLTGAGCDIFQGFYFSRPISVEDFEKKYFLEKKEQKAAVTG
jgi:EAL domain-containing protein (putative c-di-GMP-specific phosphodiesterase class I)